MKKPTKGLAPSTGPLLCRSKAQLEVATDGQAEVGHSRGGATGRPTGGAGCAPGHPETNHNGIKSRSAPDSTGAMAILELGDTDDVPCVGVDATRGQAVSMASADRPL